VTHLRHLTTHPRSVACEPSGDFLKIKTKFALLLISGIILKMIANLLPFIQIALSVALIVLILLQRSDAGVGGAFGGGDGGSGHFERRGVEKKMFNTTIILAIFFIATSILALIL